MSEDSLQRQFLDQFNKLFASGASTLGREVQDQLKAALTATLERMDLVTRDEFEAQKVVLMRTRELLHRLERQVAQLEVDRTQGNPQEHSEGS